MLFTIFFVIHTVSLITFAVLVYEFMHIHNKRIAILHDLDGADARFLLQGKKRIILAYTLCVVIITIFSFIQLF